MMWHAQSGGIYIARPSARRAPRVTLTVNQYGRRWFWHMLGWQGRELASDTAESLGEAQREAQEAWESVVEAHQPGTLAVLE